jgi:hypothetical protein
MYFKYNNRVFQTPAAEEPPVAYLEARRVPGAELLCDALVCPAAERKTSAQCGRPIGPDAAGLCSTSLSVVSATYLFSFSFFLSSLLTCRWYLIAQNVKGARPLSRVQISTMAVKDNLLMVAGGFQGELICKVRTRGLQTRQCFP